MIRLRVTPVVRYGTITILLTILKYTPTFQAYAKSRGQPATAYMATQPSDDSAFSCQVCNKLYNNQSEYIKHMQSDMHLFREQTQGKRAMKQNRLPNYGY